MQIIKHLILNYKIYKYRFYNLLGKSPAKGNLYSVGEYLTDVLDYYGEHLIKKERDIFIYFWLCIAIQAWRSSNNWRWNQPDGKINAYLNSIFQDIDISNLSDENMLEIMRYTNTHHPGAIKKAIGYLKTGDIVGRALLYNQISLRAVFETQGFKFTENDELFCQKEFKNYNLKALSRASGLYLADYIEEMPPHVRAAYMKVMDKEVQREVLKIIKSKEEDTLIEGALAESAEAIKGKEKNRVNKI